MSPSLICGEGQRGKNGGAHLVWCNEYETAWCFTLDHRRHLELRGWWVLRACVDKIAAASPLAAKHFCSIERGRNQTPETKWKRWFNYCHNSHGSRSGVAARQRTQQTPCLKGERNYFLSLPHSKTMSSLSRCPNVPNSIVLKKVSRSCLVCNHNAIHDASWFWGEIY